MLSYVKHILTRVSFDARLFEKELRKAIKMLIADEVQELKNWCYANFSREHEAILNRCFVRTWKLKNVKEKKRGYIYPLFFNQMILY